MMRGMAGRVIVWLGPHIPEASDGIVTSAGIAEGFAGAGAGTRVLLFAGFAAIVAGAIGAGAVEYSVTGSRRDFQRTQLAREQAALAATPGEELDELTGLYEARGLSRPLARQVAVELSAHDALAAHAEAEYDINPQALPSPALEGLGVAAAFAAGAVLPWLAILLIPRPPRAALTFLIVLVALALTGWITARLTDVHPARPILRTAGVGVVTMAITYAAGLLFRL